jgi:myosin heavy subunit
VVFNGIPENIKVAQAGFVWRIDWADFANRCAVWNKSIAKTVLFVHLLGLRSSLFFAK